MTFNDEIIKTCNIKIGNLTWKINLVNERNRNLYDLYADPKESDTRDAAMGMCYKNLCSIFISNDMTDQNMKRTITHELTHAILYTYGLLASRNELDEEEICNFMEIHLDEIRRLSSYCFKKLSVE